MKFNHVTHGVAVLSLVSGRLVSTVNAAHAHHHGDLLGRIMHKGKASSGSSSNVVEGDLMGGNQHRALNFTGAAELTLLDPSLPQPTILMEPVVCVDKDCDPLDAVFDSKSPANAALVQQEIVQVKASQLHRYDPPATPTRRRTYSRPTKAAIEHTGSLNPNGRLTQTLKPNPVHGIRYISKCWTLS